jgi:hypothetical protein
MICRIYIVTTETSLQTDGFVFQESKRKNFLQNILLGLYINSRHDVNHLPTVFPNLLSLLDVAGSGAELVDVPHEELYAEHGKISMPQFDCLVKEVAEHTSKMFVLPSHERFR